MVCVINSVALIGSVWLVGVLVLVFVLVCWCLCWCYCGNRGIACGLVVLNRLFSCVCICAFKLLWFGMFD